MDPGLVITSVDAKLSSGYCLTAEPDPIVSRRNRTKSARLCYEYAGEGDGEQRLQEKRWEVVRNGGQKGEACSPVLSNRSGRRQCKKHRGRTMLTFFCNGKRSSLIVNDRQPSVGQPQAYSYIRTLHLCLVCASLFSFYLHHPPPPTSLVTLQGAPSRSCRTVRTRQRAASHANS